MSKFFKGGGSSSSDTESSSDEDEIVQLRPAGLNRRPERDIRMLSESDDDEGKPRVVRSAKDKRYGELKDLIRALRNAKKIKDMNKTLNIFEDLARSYGKARAVMEREGAAVPRFYVRYLVELDTFVNETWKDAEGRKKMNKPNAKGLSNLRQKLKKYLVDFEANVKDYKESPDPEGYSSLEEAAEEELGSESEEEAVVRKLPPRSKAGDYDEGESDWSDSSGSSESDLEDLEGKKMEDLRKMFLKKVDTGRSAEDREARKAQKRARQEEKERAREKDDDDDWKTVQGGKPVERPKMFDKDADINHDAVLQKLAEILTVRGKKGTDRREMVELLRELKGISEANTLGTAMSVKIQFMIIAGMFEYNAKLSECMKIEVWQAALETINELLAVLTEHPEVIAHPDLIEERENVDKALENGKFYVAGSILTLVERLDDEFIKILQVADCHSTDYVDK